VRENLAVPQRKAGVWLALAAACSLPIKFASGCCEHQISQSEPVADSPGTRPISNLPLRHSRQQVDAHIPSLSPAKRLAALAIFAWPSSPCDRASIRAGECSHEP